MTKLISTLIFILGWGAVLNSQVVIAVTSIPESTPVGDHLYIAGNFQSWNPGDTSFRLTPNIDSTFWSISLDDLSGSIEYKFTRGEWPKVESDAQGKFVPNRQETLSPGDTSFCEILGWEDLNAGSGGNSTAGKNVNILSTAFYMPQLDRHRRIWIYLPPDYLESNRYYPVIYMHDGQNVFDAETSFAGEWRVDETLDRLFSKGDSGAIVVAIDNGGSLRTAEYTPWRNPQYGGGEGKAYIDFIVHTLKPHIDSTYRSKKNAANTGLIGSSLGGLISTYGALIYPNTFGKIGAFSPAYWINREIFDLANDFNPQDSTRIYQLAGSKESISIVANTWDMHKRLSTIMDQDVYTLEQADGQHSEWFWAREFEDCYLWLFRNEDEHVGEGLGITISPNPIQDKLIVDILSDQRTEFKMYIDQSDGRRMAKLKDGVLQRGRNRFELERSFFSWSKGVYYLRVETSDEHESVPFIIAE